MPLPTSSEPPALFTQPLRYTTAKKPHKHKEPLTMTEPQNTKQERPREVFEAIRRIEDIGVSISAQAYAYRETVTDHRTLLAKDILRLIDDAQAAGKVFRSVAEIAE